MTNEEMALRLDNLRNGRLAITCEPEYEDALKAGAAALRAGAWKPIADAPEVSRFGFLVGHVGSERIDHCFHRDTAKRLLHTHYRDLPAPPEGK